jgi:two-component system cell cycle sensor histidine kinase/response regulator CckA
VTDDLRRRAELRAQATGADPSAESGAPSSSLAQRVHDLQVHQIELERQNDELRRSQAGLEASRARYFDLYDLAPVGYVTISERGLILEANLTAATMFGVTRGALVDQPVTSFLAPEDQDSYDLHRTRLFATGAPQVVDLRVRRQDGSKFWVRFEASLSRDADELPEVCRAVVSDITEGKRIEGERLRFEHELQQAQKVESLARMAGAIAHHFNNQLAVVMSNLELCTSQPAFTGDRLADAMRATRKAAEVNGLLLTYLGQSHGSHAPLDLSETVGRSVPLLRAAMPTRVVLETTLPVPGPPVNGNANQLQLMLTNLVTNAWESVGDLESTVRVTVATVPASAIPVAPRFPAGWRPRDQAYVCLNVSDAGCGIEAQELEKIFDPFYTNKLTGRGLGLPVVLGILHAHSGGLVVRTRRGSESGSVFQAYLPVSAEQAVRAAGVAEPEVEGAYQSHWGGTVLLAEDDEMLRWTAKATLTLLGFTVLVAKDGLEAVELFRRHKDTIRLVLCDWTMPHMDGWETLAALRKLSPGIPVILSSGYDEADVMAEVSNEQPEAFLAKPYSLDALRGAIGRALRKRR